MRAQEMAVRFCSPYPLPNLSTTRDFLPVQTRISHAEGKPEPRSSQEGEAPGRGRGSLPNMREGQETQAGNLHLV